MTMLLTPFGLPMFTLPLSLLRGLCCLTKVKWTSNK